MKEKGNNPSICLVGMNHMTAPVDIRERLSFDDDFLPVFFDRACAEGVSEIVYLSTCNRIEVYCATGNIGEALETIITIFEEKSGLSRETFENLLYRKYSRDAVFHLINVVSSLDSMVVGENEIFYQVKNCYSRSVSHKKTGPILNKLFHFAFKTAKRVRTETEISRNPLSVAYIATELARKIFDDLSQRKALLVGAGEMGELILKYFTKSNISEITIANRSIQNAERIALEINRNAHIVQLDDAGTAAGNVDIIISSVSSSKYVFDAGKIKNIIRSRRNRPLFIIDIAVPRNIDPDVGSLDNVFLYNIDDLKTIADENMKNRLREVEVAKRLIEADADEFMQWFEGLTVVPVITRIQKKFNEIRTQELKRYRRRKLKHFSDDDFQLIEELTRQIMTKTLHNPITFLKEYQQKGNGHERRHDEAFDKTKIVEDIFLK